MEYGHFAEIVARGGVVTKEILALSKKRRMELDFHKGIGRGVGWFRGISRLENGK
ncbi:hypothetical protein MASR1M74_12940 [Lentimicrobium sp.]